MTKKNFQVFTDLGFSLTELVIIVSIIGIIIAIAAPEFGSQLRRSRVKDCAQKLAADIRYARASSRSEGHRAQLTISQDGKLHDLNGDGANKLWITFLDSNPNPNGSYDPGENMLSCSSCGQGVIIESAGINPLPSCDVGAIGINNRCMWFTTLGTLNNDAIDKSVVITSDSDTDFKVRVKILSMTGTIQIQSCQVSATIDCNNESDWRDI